MPCATHKDFNKAMGAVIRKHRKTLGMKQQDVGDSISVSYQQVQKFESGLNAVSAYQLTKLALLFGVSVATLYEEAGIASRRSAEPTAAENDSFLAARYVGRIADPKLRSTVIDFTRKLAYQAGDAA